MKTESERLLDLAEEGLYKKVAHTGCSNSKSVGLYSDTQRVHWYCYKCNASGYRKVGQKSIIELLEIQKEQELTKKKQDKSTKDFVSSQEIVPKDAYSIPMDKRDWLYEAGFSDRMIDSYDNLYYSPSLNRIGIRGIYYSKRWTQLRSIDGSYPKYLNRGDTPRLLSIDYDLDYIVLVEDWLSTLRLHELGINYLCLFGTNLKDEYIKVLAKIHELKTVYIWLDNDEAGHKGAKEAQRSLEFYTDLDIKVISTHKDPKMFSNEHIRNIIRSAKNSPKGVIWRPI